MTTAESVFLLPNGTFFVELAVTIILIVAFSKWVLPPLTKAMDDRQEQIRASLEAAEKARQDAEAADDERHDVLEAARSQAREIVAMAQQTSDQLRSDADDARPGRVRPHRGCRCRRRAASRANAPSTRRPPGSARS